MKCARNEIFQLFVKGKLDDILRILTCKVSKTGPRILSLSNSRGNWGETQSIWARIGHFVAFGLQ